MSKTALLEKLTDKSYRDAFISDEIDVGLPMQLRLMRESRGWKQGEVAEKMGTQQPRLSLMEKPGYGNFSLNTLKKAASVFDVGLIVSFVPFSEMIDFTEAISNKRLAIPGFVDEYTRLANRYARPRPNEVQNTSQFLLDFTSGATTETSEYQAETTASFVSLAGSTISTDILDIPVPPLFTEVTGSTYARI
jgi:transcriptional regulator with XRE-family HTH domain